MMKPTLDTIQRWAPRLSAALALTLGGMINAARACPMCKDSIPGSDAQAQGSLPGGFNTSVYALLIGLFCVIGLISNTLYKAVRSSQRYEEERRRQSKDESSDKRA